MTCHLVLAAAKRSALVESAVGEEDSESVMVTMMVVPCLEVSPSAAGGAAAVDASRSVACVLAVGLRFQQGLSLDVYLRAMCLSLPSPFRAVPAAS